MNAERLNVIAIHLRRELDSRNSLGNLDTLVSYCQQMGQNPANPGNQQNFVSARSSFYAAVTDAPSDSFTPAWRQILVEIGGEELFGKILKERVQKILADNQATLSVAYEQLNPILGKLRSFRESLTRLTDAFKDFQIGSESLAPGEAEITLLIPRKAVNDKLGEFVSELEEMQFVLNTLSEVATGHIDDLRIRTVSSSGLMVHLAAIPKFGEIVAKCIDFVVGQYKKILEIRKLREQMERLELPSDISEQTKEYANKLMGNAIEEFAVEIVSQFSAVSDDGRRHELTNQVKVSLKTLANRIDRGFNFEVRIEPPAALPKNEPEAEEVTRAVKSIQSATVNMQYMKLEGPPILALPERTAPVSGATPTDDETKHRKRGGARKDDSK